MSLLVFDRSPQPLDENIVPPGAAPIHANRDRVLYQQTRESGAAELAALDALLKVKLFLSATRVPLPGTPRLQGTNATTSAGTAVLDCPGGSTGTSRPLRFAARQGRSASGAGPSYGLPGQSRALPAWPAVETSMAENWPSRVKLRLRPDEFPVIVV